MAEYLSLLDGRPASGMPLTDSSVLRGDGVFEAIRAYAGRCFRLDDHLDRLERSAHSLGLELPDRPTVVGWAEEVARAGGDCIVRVVVSRGPAVPGVSGPPRCVVLAHPVPDVGGSIRLLPVPAPWHPAGRRWELAGSKTISYAPNLAASRRAREEGYDDALLVSDDDVVLEGPTFAVGWVRDGILCFPPLDLGVLDSITRRAVIEVADTVRTETVRLESVLGADEVIAMSTVKEVLPVVAVGPQQYAVGPVAKELAQRLSSVAAGG